MQDILFYLVQIAQRSIMVDHSIIHPRPIALWIMLHSKDLHLEYLSLLSNCCSPNQFSSFVVPLFSPRGTINRSITVWYYKCDATTMKKLSLPCQNALLIEPECRRPTVVLFPVISGLQVLEGNLQDTHQHIRDHFPVKTSSHNQVIGQF